MKRGLSGREHLAEWGWGPCAHLQMVSQPGSQLTGSVRSGVGKDKDAGVRWK